MSRKREHEEMPDRKYLFRRGGVWNVRFRLPKKYGGGVFQRSLGTGDITTAKQFRDRFVIPFLAEDELFLAASALIDKAIALGASRDKKFDQLNWRVSGTDDHTEDARPLSSLVEKYLVHIGKGDVSPATRQAYANHLDGFLRIVGRDQLAESVTKQDIITYRDKLLVLPVNWMRLRVVPHPRKTKKTVSLATVSTALDYVRAFFRWAIDEGEIESPVNPVHGVRVPFTRPSTRRPFSQLEADAACALPMPESSKAFDEEAWRALPLLARYTGARLGELAQLTGKDVVEVHGVLCLHIFESAHQGRTTKTHGDRMVPIASKIQPLVNQLRASHGDGPLFPNCGTWKDKKFGVVKPAKAFGNAFQRIVKGVAPDLSFHSFRHYAITEMANAGVHEEVRMRIVGHKGRTVHAGYTKIDVANLAKAVETIF